MPVTHKTNYLDEALDRLAGQYKATTGMVGILTVVFAQVQDLEDALWDVLSAVLLAGSGARLDLVGKIVGDPRDGAGDAAYITRLQARIRANRSSGTLANVLKVFKVLLPANTVRVLAEGGAEFALDVGAIAPADLDTYVKFLSACRSIAVRGELQFAPQSLETTFTLQGDTVLALLAGDSDVFPRSFNPYRPFDQQVIAPYELECLVTINPGLSIAESAYVTEATPGDQSHFGHLGINPSVTNAQPLGSVLQHTAAPGTWARASSGTLAGATVMSLEQVVHSNILHQHPFRVGDAVTFEPGTPRQETRTVTAADATSVTVVALTYAHAAGSHVTPRLTQGLGDVNNASTGGKLAGARSV